MNSSDLKYRFHEAMLNVYECAKCECDYKATYLLRSVTDNGGLETAKSLLSKENVSDGFTDLWECGCLHISVECLVLMPEFRNLFESDELDTARNRLKEADFDVAKCEQKHS